MIFLIRTITYNHITGRLSGEEVADYTQNYNSSAEKTTVAVNFYEGGIRAADAEAEAHVKKSLEYKQKETDLMAKYFDKFSAVLPVRKVAMLTATERKFKRLILNEIKKKRKGRRK